MADEERLDDDLSELAAQLAGFTPRPAELSTARLLFEAGRQAAQATPPPVAAHTPWYWPASTAAMSGLSTVLAVLLAVNLSFTSETRLADAEGAPEVRDQRIAAEEHPDADQEDAAAVHDADATRAMPSSLVASRRQLRLPPTWSNTPATRYVRDRDVALAFGIEALPFAPKTRGETTAPGNRRDLQREFLGSAGLGVDHPAAVPSDSGGTFDFSGFNWTRWFSSGENL